MRKSCGQLLFDFGTGTGGERLEDVLPHYDNPATDNQRLLNMQYDYLVHGSGEAWEGLWSLSYSVACRLVRNMASRHRLRLGECDVMDKAQGAVEYVLRRYAPDRCGGRQYFVRKNFVSQLRGGVLHSLFYRTKGDALVDFWDSDSINAYIDSRGTQ